MKFTAEMIKTRINSVRELGYNPHLCAEHWGISKVAAGVFIKKYCIEKQATREKPRYDNQRLADLQTLTKEQWCERWDIPLWEYASYLRKYERQCGEKLATPERRARWEKEYWEAMA